MTKQTKVLVSIVGVLAVGAVVGWAYFLNIGGLQGCIGRGCRERSVPIDLSVTGLSVDEADYNGVPYYRVTAGLKSTAPEAEWQVTLNGNDYTQSMGWEKVPVKANTHYSFDIMQKVACEGISAGSRSISINLDPNNNISEANEGNNTASVNFECKNAAVITSVALSQVSQNQYVSGKSVVKNSPFVTLVVYGQNLDAVKSVIFDDPTLSVMSVFGSIGSKPGMPSYTGVSTNDATLSGIKKVTYTDVLGFKQTFSFYVKLPIKTEFPNITVAPINGTISLSNPKISWNASKTADQYAYIDGKFIHSYGYELSILSTADYSYILSSLDSYPNKACLHDIYADADLNSESFGKIWTCDNFTLPSDVLQKLEIGKEYNVNFNILDLRKYDNGDSVLESANLTASYLTVVK